MGIFDRGFLTLFRVREIPIRAHWTVPLVCVLASGGTWAPGIWLGVLLLILLHELGHAFIVHRVGLVNLGVDLTGMGGLCRWAGNPTRKERAWVAWGGVIAQSIILAATLSCVAIFGTPARGFLAQVVRAFIEVNAFIIVLNLLPFRPLDGAEAWPLLRYLRADWKARRRWRKKLTRRPDKEPDDNPLAQTLREALREADEHDED